MKKYIGYLDGIEVSAEQHARTMERLSAPRHKRAAYRYAGLAACIAAVLIPAAFAFSGPLIQFMFGNSSAAQVESLEFGVANIKIVNRSSFARSSFDDQSKSFTVPTQQFPTVEDAQQAAPFVIKEPRYLPENAAFKNAHVSLSKNGKQYKYDAQVYYTVTIPDDMCAISLWQHYAGPDAYLELITVFPIQKVMVGDIEASAVIGNGIIWLYWIKDEVVYELSVGTVAGYDMATLIAIAESV